MSITMTVMKEGNSCKFFADMPFSDLPSKFVMTALPITFTRRALFTADSGDPMLVLPLEDAKRVAEEILAL